MAKNVIHAGGIFPNPTLNREGKASTSFMPGTICVFVDGEVKPSTDGTDGAIKYVANIDYLRCNGVKDTFTAGDLVVGIHPISGMFLNVPADTGSYKKGDALKIANGQVAVGGDASSQFFAEETITVGTAGDLIRVVVK